MAKKLQDFFQNLRDQLPSDLLTIERAVAPADYEVAALLQHLVNEQRYPALLFERPRNLKGERSSFSLLSNLFATRRRCALALGMDLDNERLPLSLEYARREEMMIAPVAIPVREAPVKRVTQERERGALAFEVAWSFKEEGGISLLVLQVLKQGGDLIIGRTNGPLDRQEIVRKLVS